MRGIRCGHDPAANGCVRMRAVVRDRYGPPEVMRLEEVAVPVAARRAGARSRRRHVGQPQRLGGPARLARVCAIRRALPTVPPHPRVRHRGGRRGRRVRRHELPARRRGVRRHPDDHGRLRRVRRRTRARCSRSSPRNCRSHRRRPCRSRARSRVQAVARAKPAQPDADQRRRRRNGRVRDRSSRRPPAST